ncbi:uncharacterized protein LOC124462049 [Drosophila willistoni]|uniref:uncharacterized protein LOC124462049 n=1 Tax=Drosophila willistoni TaxID=7260 RepID=UPI001F079688|nr:uncharacterized protein LOC124462049 [Drosophila willistoni]
MSAFLEREQNAVKRLTKTVREHHEMKHEKLNNKRNFALLNNNRTDDWFVNETELEFPPDIKSLLSKGPKFALPIEHEKLPLIKYIADGEEIVQTIKEKEKQEAARTAFSLMVKEHRAMKYINATDRAILNTTQRTYKFLKQHDDILILTSDKGNKTVAMKKIDYDHRMMDILSDLNTYRILRKDPTTRLQTKNNNLVDKLHKMGVISKIEKNRMTTTTAISPRIYGLPKIHKEGTPLRPICSSIGSPSYGLCKYIIQILRNITLDSKYNIKNTTEFKQRINNTYICNDEQLISFDVVSLFPSIPTDLALDTIRKKWTKIQEYTKIPKALFMEIVKFCIQENRYFTYKDQTFIQLKGMPMGSPASPVIADIVMENLLDTTMDKLTRPPRLLTKYVDDIFSIIHQDDIDKTLDTLNSFDRNIKFTMELEDNGKLAYLDSLVIRRGNELKLKWYRKPTASGRIINFNSKHPKTMIINTARSCIQRMLNISDKIYHKETKMEIINILKDNDFPDNVIRTLFKKHKSTIDKTKNEKHIYRSLMYQNYRKDYHIRIVMTKIE